MDRPCEGTHLCVFLLVLVFATLLRVRSSVLPCTLLGRSFHIERERLNFPQDIEGRLGVVVLQRISKNLESDPVSKGERWREGRLLNAKKVAATSDVYVGLFREHRTGRI